MIKANELRIGNYFHPGSRSNGVNIPATGLFYKVGGISTFGEVEVIDPSVKNTKVFNSKEVHPIPITPEILEKAGFVWSGADHYTGGSKENPYWIEDYAKGYRYVRPNFCHRVVKTVHEWQNLHFALFGEELNINL